METNQITPFSLYAPRLIAFLGFAAGIPVLLPVTAEILTMLAQASALFAGAALVFGIAHKPYRSVKLVLVALFAGFALNALQLLLRIDNQLPVELDGADIPATVRITGLPQFFVGEQTRAVFYARVETAADAPKIEGNMIRLSWYRPPPAEILTPGSRWSVTARLKRPRGSVNPGGFDYQAWLLERKVSASGYVRDKDGYRALDKAPGMSFDRLRFRLAQAMFRHREGDSNTPLLRALLLGDRAGMSAEHWQVLQKTGTVHLMAISGLHIGLVATIGFLLGTGIARLLSLWRAVGCRSVAPAFAIGLATLYAGLAGFAIPTQRALVMVILFSSAVAIGRKLNYWHVFVIAFAIVVFLDPFAFMAPGFWLSFAAVAVLVAVFSARKQQTRKLLSLLKAQFWLLIGLALPLSLLGLPVSGLAPLANLFAVPLVSLAVVPLLLLAAVCSFFSLPLSLLLLDLASRIFGVVWIGLEWLANTDWRWQIPPPSDPATLVAALLGVLLLLAPTGMRLRVLGVALFLPFLFPQGDDEPFQLTALDVQQGLALLVQSQGSSLVYDTGARFSDTFDMGSRVLAPYIQRQHIRVLDDLIVSHGDIDHAGGYTGLIELIPSKNVYSGQPARLPGDTIRRCVRGQHWQRGGLEVSVIWPTVDAEISDSNNHSCVLILNYKTLTILLPGDIEKSVEQQLLQAGVLPTAVDILVVPHHGSRTSSSQALLNQIRPRFAVISVGYRNRYHLPSKAVLKRYQELGTTVLRTDLDGAITFSLNKQQELQISRERQDKPRPWFW